MKKALIKLHTAVLLAGATGLFGRLLTLQEIPLVWYRVIFSAVIIVCFLKVTGRMEKVPVRNALHICLVGMLLALHWVLFYASIRYSNVSIGVLCCALIVSLSSHWSCLSSSTPIRMPGSYRHGRTSCFCWFWPVYVQWCSTSSSSSHSRRYPHSPSRV